MERVQLKINLPADVFAFVATESAKNMRSKTSEIILALKARMQMTAGQVSEAEAPAVIEQTDARQGADPING